MPLDPAFPERNRWLDNVTNKRGLAKKKRAKERAAGAGARDAGAAWETAKPTEADCARETAVVTSVFASAAGLEFEVRSPDGSRKTVGLAQGLDPALAAGVAVGDRVALAEGGISARLPRANVLSRFRGDSNRFGLAGREKQAVAANVDLAVVVIPGKLFRAGFADRYLALCCAGGVPGALCVSKIDEARVDEATLAPYRALGLPVFETSATTGAGVPELQAALRGKTCVLVGASGAGKSTLANALFGAAVAAVGDVHAKSGAGRHTTTRSGTFEWEPGSFLIDTPGIRSLELGDVAPRELGGLFAEFAPYAGRCKFRDCLHRDEPGCAVRAHAQTGEIAPARYESYVRILEGLS